MKLSPATAMLCLGVLGLSACSDNGHAVAANPKICVDFKAAKPAAVALPEADMGAGPLDECVRRWAYSLAPSRDAADTVAEAVVGACNGPLTRWNGQVLSVQGSGEAASLTTGEPTTPLAEHNAFAHGRALLYVVQARAGACAPPPATNGVPDGVS
jgi:hypothetical protein